MPQFLVIAYDGTDSEAKSRREKARPAHFEQIKPLVETGKVYIGGALLDGAGNMIGSALFYNCSSKAELNALIARDPYVTGKVWERIEIKPMLIAPRTSRHAGPPAGSCGSV